MSLVPNWPRYLALVLVTGLVAWSSACSSEGGEDPVDSGADGPVATDGTDATGVASALGLGGYEISASSAGLLIDVSDPDGATLGELLITTAGSASGEVQATYTAHTGEIATLRSSVALFDEASHAEVVSVISALDRELHLRSSVRTDLDPDETAGAFVYEWMALETPLPDSVTPPTVGGLRFGPDGLVGVLPLVEAGQPVATEEQAARWYRRAGLGVPGRPGGSDTGGVVTRPGSLRSDRRGRRTSARVGSFRC